MSANLLKPFVRNRAVDIQMFTNVKNWKYVPTKDNPEDPLSRGLNPVSVVSSEF